MYDVTFVLVAGAVIHEDSVNDMKRVKALLLSVPLDNPVYLPTGLGYLAAFAKHKLGQDAEIVQRDLNADFFEWVLGGPLIRSMQDAEQYRKFDTHLQSKEHISMKLRRATSDAVDSFRNSFSYRPHEDYKSRDGILQAIGGRHDNAFFKFFDSCAVPYIHEINPDIVGISVRDQKQYLTAFILASMVKEKLPDAKIVLGGNVITRNYDVHSRDDAENRGLLAHVDGIIHHEGEIAFTEYLRAVSGEIEMSEVPKLIYGKKGKIAENLEFPIAPMECIPPPDYSGFVAQGNYWTPSPVIPYIIARGCYWGQCAFCDIPIGYDFSGQLMAKKEGKELTVSGPTGSPRRECGFEKVVSDLAKLGTEYETRWFSFGDEELDVDTLNQFSARSNADTLPLEFECYSRMEQKYVHNGANFCERLRRSGCRFLQFGLESVSPHVLQTNRKYVEPYERGFGGELFKATYEAGIMNHAFLLVGLPGDSLLEGSRLIPFLEENGQYLTTIKPVFHKISKWSPIAQNPDEYGIVLDREGSGDLDININLGKGSAVMSRRRAEAFVRFLDLWVRRHHKVNAATSQFIYAQRLFLTRDELEEIGSRYDQPTSIDEHDGAHLRKVYAGLIDEFKAAAYSREGIPVEHRKRFAAIYRQRKGTSAAGFDDVLDLVKAAADVQADLPPGATVS